MSHWTQSEGQSSVPTGMRLSLLFRLPRGTTVSIITMIVCYARAPLAMPVWTASTEPDACPLNSASSPCQRRWWRRHPHGAPDSPPFPHRYPSPPLQFLCCRTWNQQVGLDVYLIMGATVGHVQSSVRINWSSSFRKNTLRRKEKEPLILNRLL